MSKKKILLSNALNWLSEIGVDYFNSRIHKYQNDLSILIDRIDIQDPQSLVDPQFFATMVNSIYESGELIRIHNSLKDLIVTPDLKNKIKVFIKGPEYANDEKPMTGSQQPRDIAFELIIASMFLRAGYKIDFHTTADLRAQNDKSTFFVECKRPRSIHSVRANVRSAASQLRKRYISYSNNDNTVYGIIALSIDMIVNPKNYMLIANDEQAIDNRMIAEAQEFIQNNDMHWKSIPDINTLGNSFVFTNCCSTRKS